MIKTVKIFQEYELNIDELSEKKLSNNINDDKIKENNSLYFIDIQIEKLILKFNLLYLSLYFVHKTHFS